MDGNPFLEPWATLIGPILDNGGQVQPGQLQGQVGQQQQGEVYPGSTPVVPLQPLAQPESRRASEDDDGAQGDAETAVAAPTPFSNNFLTDLPGLPINNHLGIDDSIAAAIVASTNPSSADPPLRRSFSNPQTRSPSAYEPGYEYGIIGSRPPSEAHPSEPLSPTMRSSRFGSPPASNGPPAAGSAGVGGRLRLEPARPPPPIPTHAPPPPPPAIPDRRDRKDKSREREKETPVDVVGSYLFALDSTFVGGGVAGENGTTSRKGTSSKNSIGEEKSRTSGPTASMSSIRTASTTTQRQPGIRRMKSADELTRMGGGPVNGGPGGSNSAYYANGNGPVVGSPPGSKPLGSAPLLPHIAGITDEQELPGRRFESLPRGGPSSTLR